jgi:hypothetical protein
MNTYHFYKMAIVVSYDNYVNTIRNNLSLDPKDWFFKSDPAYTPILEHVTEHVGNRYFTEIKERFPSYYNDNKNLLIELCYKNDLYGKTKKSVFTDFTICSPTNLRYILHSFLILQYIQSIELNNLNIIEIGGGYGGLYFFLKHLSPLFGVSINTYTIFDLKEASDLQNLYLDNLQVSDYSTQQLNNLGSLYKNSFLISNYAFSEISPIVQNEYIEKVIKPYVSNGFILWNHIKVYPFIDKKLYIEKASRVSYEAFFDNHSTMDYELKTDTNYVEEVVVTF